MNTQRVVGQAFLLCTVALLVLVLVPSSALAGKLGAKISQPPTAPAVKLPKGAVTPKAIPSPFRKTIVSPTIPATPPTGAGKAGVVAPINIKGKAGAIAPSEMPKLPKGSLAPPTGAGKAGIFTPSIVHGTKGVVAPINVQGSGGPPTPGGTIGPINEPVSGNPTPPGGNQ